MNEKANSSEMQVAIGQSVISAEAAAVALQAAIAHAERIGVRINVAVSDSGGNLAGFLRMPGAFIQSIDIEIGRAHV